MRGAGRRKEPVSCRSSSSSPRVSRMSTVGTAAGVRPSGESVEVTPDLVEQARANAALKRPAEVVARVRLDHLAEGRAAQILHTGPDAAEGPTIQHLHAFIAEPATRAPASATRSTSATRGAPRPSG